MTMKRFFINLALLLTIAFAISSCSIPTDMGNTSSKGALGFLQSISQFRPR